MEQENVLRHAGAPNPIDSTGLCLLSLDGGGVRGLSSLFILQRIMHQINDARGKNNKPSVKPCEVFDLIGGTSTGGLIAIMLGRLEMDVDDCITAYSKLMAEVFDERLRSVPVNLRGDIQSRFSSIKLKDAIQKVIESCQVSKEELFDNGVARGCKTFVCTADRCTKHIIRLRSYRLSDEPDIPTTIWEAALATSAATTFFDTAEIGDWSFADGAFGANNPVEEVEGEASNIWCPETGELKPLVKCFISIGTGHPGIKPFEDGIFKFLKETLTQIVTETEETERKFMARWALQYEQKRYFRFNVQQGLQDIGLEEHKKKATIASTTRGYLTHTTQKTGVRALVRNMEHKERNAHTSVLYAPQAAWNSRNTECCLPGTRLEVLHSIRAWIDSDESQHMFWLVGWPGTGKSIIARTIARALDGGNDQHWVASFFFSRGNKETGHGERFCSTIAWQLCSNQSKFRNKLEEAFSADQLIFQQTSLIDQWKELIAKTISRLDCSPVPTRLVIVIDALDECESDNDIDQILQFLADPGGAFNRTRLRVLITSRPESRIRNLTQFPAEPDLVLQRVNEVTVNSDVAIFLRHNLSQVATESEIQALVKRSAGIFVWAEAACRYINQRKGAYAADRLCSILENTDASPSCKRCLDEIYNTVLEQCLPPEYMKFEEEQLRRLLGTIAVLLSPLSERSLGVLLNMLAGYVDEALDYCHSILDLPPDKNSPLKMHHASFRDFLLDGDRCGNPKFLVCEKEANRVVFKCCVDLISKRLAPNMCGKEASGTTVSEVTVDDFLPSEVQYACLHWVRHLKNAAIELGDLDCVFVVLEKHLLHWIEALSWMGKVSEAISSILTLLAIIQDHSRVSSHSPDQIFSLT
ncbi:unnamed protein product [Penicillium salamii]|uniref:PNPLA domain-containing protein n=1 Tax=Penicillium salamii TaxID=1612424 RepID=A0A9W4IY51_9EURO|nr:unnamed protein product [Penicillium salamii]